MERLLRFLTVLGRDVEIVIRRPDHSRAVGVLMSVRHYERLRGAAWECLTETMDAMGDEAARNSLTKSSLNALFENES